MRSHIAQPRGDGALEIRETLRRLLEKPEDVVLVAESESGVIQGWIHGSAARRLVAAVEAWGRGRGLPRVLVRSRGAPGVGSFMLATRGSGSA